MNQKSPKLDILHLREHEAQEVRGGVLETEI